MTLLILNYGWTRFKGMGDNSFGAKLIRNCQHSQWMVCGLAWMVSPEVFS